MPIVAKVTGQDMVTQLPIMPLRWKSRQTLGRTVATTKKENEMSLDMSRFPEKWPEWEDTREEPNFDDGYDDEEEMVWSPEQENENG